MKEKDIHEPQEIQHPSEMLDPDSYRSCVTAQFRGARTVVSGSHEELLARVVRFL